MEDENLDEYASAVTKTNVLGWASLLLGFIVPACFYLTYLWGLGGEWIWFGAFGFSLFVALFLGNWSLNRKQFQPDAQRIPAILGIGLNGLILTLLGAWAALAWLFEPLAEFSDF